MLAYWKQNKPKLTRSIIESNELSKHFWTPEQVSRPWVEIQSCQQWTFKPQPTTDVALKLSKKFCKSPTTKKTYICWGGQKVKKDERPTTSERVRVASDDIFCQLLFPRSRTKNEVKAQPWGKQHCQNRAQICRWGRRLNGLKVHSKWVSVTLSWRTNCC